MDFNKIRQKIYNFLRYTERYTKTDMVYLAKGGAWLMSGQFIYSISSFLLAISFANLLPKDVYGTYKFVLSTTGILTIFTLTGMGTAVTQASARGYEGSFLPAVKEKIKWGIFGGIVGIGLAVYYYFKNDSVLAAAFLIAAIFLPFMDSAGIYSAFLSGKKLFDVSTKYAIISQIIAIILLISSLFLTKNVLIMLFVYFLSWTFLRFIFLKKTLHNFPPNSKNDPYTISYGKHLSFMGVLGILAENLDKILLWHYLGAVSVAVYAIAQAPVNQISALLKNVLPLSFPKLAVAENEDIKKTLPWKMAKFFIIILFVVIFYILLIPYFYKIFFPQYLESINYTRLFALTLLFFPQKLIGTALQAKACKKFLYIMQISNSLLRIVLFFILLPIWGIYGAIAANLAGYAANTILQFYFLKKL